MNVISTGLSKSAWQTIKRMTIVAIMSGSLLAGLGSSLGRAGAANDYGTPDPTFGDAGLVTTDINSDFEWINSMAVQPDGKIVVVGESWPNEEEAVLYTMARYNEDGTLDETFAKTGKLTARMIDSEQDWSGAQAVTLQDDGKIIVVGPAFDPKKGHEVFATLRYNEDGTLDSTFGKKGRVFTPITKQKGDKYLDWAAGVAVDADGKILVVGSAGSVDESDSVVVRYNEDGSLDTEFGTKGIALVDMGGADDANAIALQEDGKIVIGGQASTEDYVDMAIARLNSDGTLDTDFAAEGVQAIDVKGGSDNVNSLAVLPDGRILVGGSGQVGEVNCIDEETFCPKFGPTLVMLGEDGLMDESWAEGGGIVYTFDDSVPMNSMAVREDGMIAGTGTLGGDIFATLLFGPDGYLDESFGEDGVALTEFEDATSRSYSVAWQPDGKLVAAGEIVTEAEESPYGDYDFALVRLQAPPIDTDADAGDEGDEGDDSDEEEEEEDSEEEEESDEEDSGTETRLETVLRALR